MIKEDKDALLSISSKLDSRKTMIPTLRKPFKNIRVKRVKFRASLYKGMGAR